MATKTNCSLNSTIKDYQSTVEELQAEISKLKGQLKESEERADAIFNLGANSEAIVILQDFECKEAVQTYVSEQWPRITGYSKDELIGMSFIDLERPGDRAASLERHRLKMDGEAMPGSYTR
jgi:PAS domain S-box-containing protein